MLALVEVVGTHDAPCVALLDSGLKRGQINLAQCTVAHDDVDLMAVFLVIVQTEVLDTGSSARALQTLDIRRHDA